MEKLSIFGGKGFIGSNFARRYPEVSNVIDRNSKIPYDDNILYLISTTDNYNVFTDLHLDIDTNLNKLMEIIPNVKGTVNFVSSWFVYGNGYEDLNNEASEDDPCNPRGFYSITKKAAEDLLISYCKTFNKNYRIIRLCNVIGGDPGAGKKKNALEFLIGNIINNEDVLVYTGNNYRNFLHVDDVSDALKLITESGELNTVYNVGSVSSTRLLDILEYVKFKCNSTSNLNFTVPTSFHTIIQTPNFFMNTNKVRGLGFVQKYDVYEAFDRVILRLGKDLTKKQLQSSLM